MKIAKNAKNTDVLCSEVMFDFVNGFILNNNLLNLLKKFNLPLYKTYTLNLTKNGHKIEDDYMYFVIYEECIKYIDFNKSNFYLFYHFKKDKNRDIAINSENELKDVFFKSVLNSYPYKTICAKKIVLPKQFVCDVFRIDYLTNDGYYVSERLKEAIEKEGFTGLIFEEADNIVIEE